MMSLYSWESSFCSRWVLAAHNTCCSDKWVLKIKNFPRQAFIQLQSLHFTKDTVLWSIFKSPGINHVVVILISDLQYTIIFCLWTRNKKAWSFTGVCWSGQQEGLDVYPQGCGSSCNTQGSYRPRAVPSTQRDAGQNHPNLSVPSHLPMPIYLWLLFSSPKHPRWYLYLPHPCYPSTFL